MTIEQAKELIQDYPLYGSTDGLTKEQIYELGVLLSQWGFAEGEE